MSSLLYGLQIITLAAWISVLGFGAVGWGWRVRHEVDFSTGEADGARQAEVYLGGLESWSPAGDSGRQPTESQVTAEIMPPPALPELADAAPLPQLPQLPPERPSNPEPSSPTAVASPGSSASKPRPSTPVGDQIVGAAGESAGGAANRLASGSMPPPRYPREARARGQSGTVVVEFTIGEDGRVTSAVASEPSRWPLLNREALRTVRRWKFPPGDVMKLQRPIIFKLR